MDVAVFAMLLSSLLRESMPLSVNFFTSQDELTWEKARDFCEHAKGRLVVLDSWKKWEKFVEHDFYQREHISAETYWIGLRFHSSHSCLYGMWRYTGWGRWSVGEPNNCPGDPCIRLAYTYMLTTPCQLQYQALCEIEVAETTSARLPTDFKTTMQDEYVAPTTSLGTTSVVVTSMGPPASFGTASEAVPPTTFFDTTSVAATHIAPTTTSTALTTVNPTTAFETTSIAVTPVDLTTSVDIGTTSVVAPITPLETASAADASVSLTTYFGMTSVDVSSIALTTPIRSTSVPLPSDAQTSSLGRTSVVGVDLEISTAATSFSTALAINTISVPGKSPTTTAVDATSVLPSLNRPTMTFMS